MDVFLTLLNKILPLYIIMGLGYLTGKYFRPDTKSIATLAIFVVSPMVFLITTSKMEFVVAALFAPALIFGISVAMSLIVLKLGTRFMDAKSAYLSALMTGTSNWGYFGVPIAFFLFPPEQVALYVVIGFGSQIFENSFGIYFISRGHLSPSASFKNVFKFPVLYAILIGLGCSALSIQLPVISDDEFFQYFKGAYVVLGMMTIGLGLADMNKLTIDKAFLATVFSVRFILWPLAILAVIAFDKHVLTLLGSSFYSPLLLFSVMPMAANNIAFAAKFDMGPGRAAVACVGTTLFALGYIPMMIKILGIE